MAESVHEAADDCGLTLLECELQSVIPTEKLREYIAYCRANCHPTISSAAATRLVDTYVRMRSAGMSRKVLTTL